MQSRRKRNILGTVFGLFSGAIKCGLFLLVVLAFINEFLIYSIFTADGAPAYARLTDYNDYLIALAATFVACFAYFSFGLIRKRGLLGVDLLLSVMIVVYIFLNFEPWVANIDSGNEGYGMLLINVKLIFHLVLLAMTLVYTIVVCTCALYNFFFSVENTMSFSPGKTTDYKHDEKKYGLLVELQQRMKSLENSHDTIQDYCAGVRDIYKEKLKLHEGH